jgi:Tfp pilus assembly protein PilF
MICTPVQAGYWQNTRTLFMRAARVTDQNYLAYYNLGCYAKDEGDYAQAILYFKTALAAEADNAPWANHARAYNNLGYAYLHQGDIASAVADFEKAVELQPIYPEAYYNLGRAFQDNNQPDVALEAFKRALDLDPNVAEIHYRMANAFLQLGKNGEAISHYSQALQLNPGLDDAAYRLAWLLATCPDRSLRDGPKAVALARRASEHSHNQNPVILGTLAAAYAETGQLSEAAATAQRASQLALAQKNNALAGALESQWRQYKNGLGGSPP